MNRIAAVVLTMLVAIPAGCTSSAPPADDAPAAATTTVAAAPVAAAPVDRLMVRSELSSARSPYVRDRFGADWDYDPATGCNTREKVLIEESLQAPAVDDRCRSTQGLWRSAYDGQSVDDPAELQIDHLVALADAWRSGADSWSDGRRQAFANDLGNPASLIAVTGSTNQSKSDSSPDQWLPPDRTSWCDYARDWVAVKVQWELSVTAAEKATLVAILDGC